MIETGKYNVLKSVRLSDYGMYLTDEEGEEVLLPNKYVPEDMLIGDEIEVFVYNDSEDRPVATTRKPRLIRGEFGYLKVREVNPVGAFLDWGLEKDLLVPFREQKKDMVAGRSYLVYLYLDEKTNRLVATAKINRYFETEQVDIREGDEVHLLIAERTDLGVNVIVNNRYRGLIFNDSIHKPLRPGQKTTGWVKQVRPDKKLDITLQPQGYKQVVEPNAQHILEQLHFFNGYLDLNDKSDPAEIAERLHMSKKVFKKAIGALYKQRLIRIEHDGIYLVE